MIDDVVTGDFSVQKVQHRTQVAIDVFQEGHFELHKFHSNVSCLEGDRKDENTETKILGVPWDKHKDLIGVDYRSCKEIGLKESTKRGVLKGTDLLGLTSPLLLNGKLLYRDM